MRTLLVSVVGAALLLCPVTASAQSQDKLVCNDKKNAKRDFVKGRLAYRRGDYEEAIVKWQDSYAACQKPLTLFNIGNAYERMGALDDLRAALKHFEEYVPLAPKHERADLSSRMEGLRKRIAELEKTEADLKAKEEAARKAEEDRTKREAEELEGEEDVGGDGGMLPIIGWSMVGVGGAAVIAGLVMDGVAASKRPDEAEACDSSTGRLLCRQAQKDDIEGSNTLALAGDITWIAGAVIAAGGATILILDMTGALDADDGGDAATNEPWIRSAHIAPFGAGAQLFGTF